MPFEIIIRRLLAKIPLQCLLDQLVPRPRKTAEGHQIYINFFDGERGQALRRGLGDRQLVLPLKIFVDATRLSKVSNAQACLYFLPHFSIQFLVSYSYKSLCFFYFRVLRSTLHHFALRLRCFPSLRFTSLSPYTPRSLRFVVLA